MTQQPQGWGAPPQQQYPQGFPQQAPQQNPWGPPPGQQPQQQHQAAVPVQQGEEFDDFFSGGVKGAPGFDFGAANNGGEKAVGAQVMGTITAMAKMQQIDYATKQPLWWDDGQPRMQVAITLQTELRNWAGVKPKLIPIDDATQQPKAPHLDNGERRVFVKGDMQRAINVACAKAGQKPRIGGKLAVRVRGFEPTNRGNDKVVYDAAYEPAPEKAPTDSFFDHAGQLPQGQQQVQNQTGQSQPVYQPPAGQGYAPQQNPSSLGNAQAPQTPPEWAQQQGNPNSNPPANPNSGPGGDPWAQQQPPQAPPY